MAKSTERARLSVIMLVALAFAFAQTLVGTLLVAFWHRDALLAPYALVRIPIYDFCVKLLYAVPGIAEIAVRGGLDRFVASGFAAKLTLAAPLLWANTLLLVPVACALAAIGVALRRPLRAPQVVALLTMLGAVVHALDGLRAVGAFAGGGWARSYTVQAAVGDTALACGVLAVSAAVSLLALRLGVLTRVALAVVAVSFVVVAAATGHRPAPLPDGAAAAASGPAAAAEAVVDNVVLVSIDSLRADRLSSYGNTNETSPAIDALARDGVRFARALATSPWTLPSHMSLLTGRDALAHGVNTEADSLAEKIPTLAERLRSRGFATGAVVSEGVLLAGRRGFGRGFDWYDDTSVAQQMQRLGDETAPVTTELAADWLRNNHDDRFFLFVHYWDVHYDYAPPAPYDSMFDPHYAGDMTGVGFVDDGAVDASIAADDLAHVLALYDGEVRWVDEHVGRLLALLDELGLAGRTAVLVTSDHGDEFFEHGGKGHGLTLYDEIVHVPLVLRSPGLALASVVDRRVTLADVMPTILELTGVPAPPGMTGASLLSAVRAREEALPKPDRPAYALRCYHRGRGCSASVRSDRSTIIARFWPFDVERYAANDAYQRESSGPPSSSALTDELNDLVVALDRQWAEYRTVGDWPGIDNVDAETRERLEALGYVQ